MHILNAAVLLGTAALVTAAPVVEERDVRGALPASASEIENRFQPVLDFDKDGCYYTSAIDSSGNVNPGLGPVAKSPSSDCRDANRLENNNLYSRSRCNNGWCAIMYEYYFEKDQTVWGSYGTGHRHDWENVIVFTKDNAVQRVAPSCHGKYDQASNTFRSDESGRPKIVYHQDGGLTHCFRHANEQDEQIENYTGKWFLGNLIGWNNWSSNDLRAKMLANWAGGVGPKLPDDKFAGSLRAAAGDAVAGFNPDVDG
ncbi:necrosis inducing protein [Podospora didyma]|uniref:Necrosis inducing protein n=1 Tax=Podospora didyma TaxID=330526 RepID=A0AAE0U1U9_9PEZI|nr:necrosis inducing protein [Podospora didyma]